MPRIPPIPSCQELAYPVIAGQIQVATIVRCVTSRGKTTRLDVWHHDPADYTNRSKLKHASAWRTEPRSPTWHVYPPGAMKGVLTGLNHHAAAAALLDGSLHPWTMDEIARHIIPHLADLSAAPARSFRTPADTPRQAPSLPTKSLMTPEEMLALELEAQAEEAADAIARAQADALERAQADANP